MALESFSESDFSLALKRNIRALTVGKFTSEHPEAILLGGQSGAGKTLLHRIKKEEFQSNIIIIDGDLFRFQHPNYEELYKRYGKDAIQYTNAFAGKMVEELILDLSEKGYSLLIEGTLRNSEVPKKTAKLLKSRKYHVSLVIMACKPELSHLSTIIRYEEMYSIDKFRARATERAIHDEIVQHLVSNIEILEQEKIFENIQVYQRDSSCVYDSEIDSGEASQKVKEILFGQWSLFEKEMLKSEEERLKKLQERNGNTEESKDSFL